MATAAQIFIDNHMIVLFFFYFTLFVFLFFFFILKKLGGDFKSKPWTDAFFPNVL